MRRTVKLLAAVAVMMAAAGVSALAQQSTPHLPRVPAGETYLRADIWKNVVGQVTPLPRVDSPDDGMGMTVGRPSRPGGDISTGRTKSGYGSPSPIGATFGAAFLTTSERTEKDIRKVIKRLG